MRVGTSVARSHIHSTYPFGLGGLQTTRALDSFCEVPIRLGDFLRRIDLQGGFLMRIWHEHQTHKKVTAATSAGVQPVANAPVEKFELPLGALDLQRDPLTSGGSIVVPPLVNGVFGAFGIEHNTKPLAGHDAVVATHVVSPRLASLRYCRAIRDGVPLGFFTDFFGLIPSTAVNQCEDVYPLQCSIESIKNSRGSLCARADPSCF